MKDIVYNEERVLHCEELKKIHLMPIFHGQMEISIFIKPHQLVIGIKNAANFPFEFVRISYRPINMEYDDVFKKLGTHNELQPILVKYRCILSDMQQTCNEKCLFNQTQKLNH